MTTAIAAARNRYKNHTTVVVSGTTLSIPAGISYVRLITSGSAQNVDIIDIEGAPQGHEIVLFSDDASYAITFRDNQSGTNIALPGTSVAISDGEAIVLKYDSTDEVWMYIGGSPTDVAETELQFLDGAAAGVPAASKAFIADANGLLRFAAPQTIAMNDAQVVLTLSQGSPTGTLITSNVLYVDAESGTTEDLLLPPEAGASGLILFIVNTGGEDIVVKEDGDSTTIVTISTAQVGYVVCNGTSWAGGISAVT